MKARSVSEAAKELNLSPQRVRVLARSGVLDAEKVGNQWLVKDVEQVRRSHPGRPLSAANAWGVLALVAGEDADWLDASVRSRLRRRLREPGWSVEAVSCSQARAAIKVLRVLPGDLSKLEAEILPSGLSARYSELDVLSSAEHLDGYVNQRSFEAIRRRFRPLSDPARSNLILRIPSGNWVLQHQDRVPLAVAAADLLSSDDPRAKRAAHAILSDLPR